MTATLVPAEARERHVRSSGAPRVGMASTLLSFTDRMPRFCLLRWADQLLADLDANLSRVRKPRDLAMNIGGIASNTALIATYHGRKRLARELCAGQMSWQHRMSRRSGVEAITGLCTDPWVNMGRLDALAGDSESALARFAALGHPRNRSRIRLGAVHIPGSAWEVNTPTRAEFEETLENVYIIESLKALLMAGRFVEAMEFAAGPGAEARPRLHRFGEEATIVAASRVGDLEHAREVAAAASRRWRAWDRVVFRLRLAEACCCAEDLDAAADVLAPIVSVVLQVAPERKQSLQILPVLLRIADACREAGLEDEAIGVATDAYQGARSAGDQCFEIEALRILAALARDGRREDDLARLQKETAYLKYRSPDAGPFESPVLDRLYERVTQVLAA